MKNFMLGIIIGSLLTTIGVQAKDFLGRSPQQQQYDYFRERGLQLDVENMRKQQTEDRLRGLGKNPC